MENNKEDSNCSKCSCHGICGMHGMCGHHHWMHLIIKILVAIFIFWCGVQLGELRGMLHGYYGNYRMMGSYYEGGRNIMNGGGVTTGGYGVIPPKSTTATTTKK